MKYTIENNTPTERFITISREPSTIHIYKYDNHELLFVATVFPVNAGFNPLELHDEVPIRKVKNVKEAIEILKTFKQGDVKRIATSVAHEMLCQ